MKLQRFLASGVMLVVLATAPGVVGCKSDTPTAPAMTTTTTTTTTKSPAPAASSAASPDASGSPAASDASASPAASDTTAASPVAKAQPKEPPPANMKYEDYEEAGVAMAVPENFTEWEKLDNGWWATKAPDDSLVLLCHAEEWKEWDDVLKGTKDLLPEFKASDDPVTKGKTKDGIEVWYDYGSASLWKKPHAVLIAGYLMQEHDFVMVLAWPPDKTDQVKGTIEQIYGGVVRMAKYQNQE